IDEFHKTKNNSLQSKACGALIRHFLTEGKIALLSATPFDHIRHIVNTFKLLGILTHATLCTRKGNLAGFLEVVQFCHTIDAKRTQTCIQPYQGHLTSMTFTMKKAKEASLALWADVIAPRYVFAMSQQKV